jgi:hypothetical protein
MKRKKSAQEVASTKQFRKGMVPSQLSQAYDDVTLPPPKSKTCSCKSCRCQGHGQFACSRINKFGSPLQNNNEEIWSSLAQQIVHQTAFIVYSLEGDKRVVYKSLPKIVTGTCFQTLMNDFPC